jgi:RHS repeat-associated protein
VTSATDPLGHVTQFAYDTQGNLATVTDPLGHATQIAYNGVGQPVSATDALGNVTQFAYNGQGDLATITDPLGNTSSRAYDVMSRLITQTDPRGKATTFTYDVLNRLTRLADPLGAMTAFSHDGNGNLLTVTDPGGGTIAYAYDGMDRVTTRTDPLGQPETYTYDLAGNVTSVLDRKGQTTAITYDALGRRSVTTYADGSTVTATYDAGGRLTSLADSVAGTISWTYDVLDRVTSETTPQGTVSYAYDAVGRRTTMTVAGQSPVAYTYDTADRLLTIAKDTLTATYAYDNSNRRTALTLPNGVTTQYSYDQASRLTGLTYVGPGGPLGDLTYTYDAAGNRIAVGGSWARTLLPDPIASASYDAANRQLTFGGKTMTFDATGNLVNMTEGGQATTYTWDARGRLASLSGPVSASFAYDATARRTQKTVSGQTTTLQYDGLDIVQESGAAAVNYLRGLAIDEHLARLTATTAEHYLPDALGSTLSLTDATGTVTTTHTYGPFGQATTAGPASPNAFQYTGRENDETGLSYLRARYYHPSLGRFLSEDPIGIRGGTNVYRYGRNNPIRFRDPLGLLVESVEQEMHDKGFGWMTPQEAVDEAMARLRKCNLQTPNVTSVGYDATLRNAGEALNDWGKPGPIKIGHSAFTYGWPYLKYVLGHEVVHTNQIAVFSQGAYPTNNALEIGAYRWGIRNSTALGLGEAKYNWIVDDLVRRLVQHERAQAELDPLGLDTPVPENTPDLGCKKP